jgi:hypothetical protein
MNLPVPTFSLCIGTIKFPDQLIWGITRITDFQYHEHKGHFNHMWIFQSPHMLRSEISKNSFSFALSNPKRANSALGLCLLYKVKERDLCIKYLDSSTVCGC